MRWLLLFTALSSPCFAQSRAEDFVQGIGVNQHLGWTGTVYGNADLEAKELAYLGVTLVRDAAPQSYDLAGYQMLASLGMRFNLLVGAAGQDVSHTLPGDISGAAALAKSHPGSVVSVEAPNELNGQIVYLNGGSSANPSVGAAITSNVSGAVRSDAVLSSQGVKVVNLSVTNGIGGWESYISSLGNLSAKVDHGNWHVYLWAAQPAEAVASMHQYALVSAPGKPVIYTETGYSTKGGSPWGGELDEPTQARHTLNLLADTAKAGILQTYIYQLMDGDQEHFGLFNADGTPKQVATAIRNLTYTLHDSAKDALTFAPTQLNWSVSGMPSQGNAMALEKSGGTFDFILWNEAQDWNGQSAPVSPTTVTLNLGAQFDAIKVINPLQSSDPIQTSSGSSVSLALGSDMMIVEAGKALSLPTAQTSPVAQAPSVKRTPQVNFTTARPAMQPSSTITSPSYQTQLADLQKQQDAAQKQIDDLSTQTATSKSDVLRAGISFDVQALTQELQDAAATMAADQGNNRTNDHDQDD